MEAKQQAVDPHSGTWIMGPPGPPHAHPANQQAAATWPLTGGGSHNPGPYPTYGDYSGNHYSSSNNNTGNPYVQVTPVPGSKDKGLDAVLKLLGRCGKKMEDGTRKATDVAGNVWHHLKTSPSVYDAAMARLSQGTKVLAEGGNDKIFQQTFGIFPGEQLRKAFACYISTSSGPVIGTLYLSTRQLAFCSDNPLCHYSAVGPQEWVYYKVVMQLDQLGAVNPSVNTRNPAEKYIQVITTDNHEFWFMGFVSYDKALKALSESLRHSHA